MRISCHYCLEEFELEKERVRGVSVARGEIEYSLLKAFGLGDNFKEKTEYRIYCPKCERAVAKFCSNLLDI